MILPRTTLDEAETLAERIRASVAMLDPGHPDLHVTMSIGVSAFPESAKDSDGVLGAADAALLRAKSGGRNRVCLYTDAIADATAQLEGELAAVGRRFAAFIGLSEAEAAGLVTALAVHETGAAVQDQVQAILGRDQTGAAAPNEVRQSAVEALVYGNERWDGAGYPEGQARGGDPSRRPRLRRLPALGPGQAQRRQRRRPAWPRRSRARPEDGPALRGDAPRRAGRAQLTPARPARSIPHPLRPSSNLPY